MKMKAPREVAAKGLGILQEFKQFAMKGNVVDLAVGLMLGAAFNGVVTSVVNDVIMPPLGFVLGKVNFADLFINLSAEEYATVADAKAAGAATINYGLFFNATINFLIVGFVTFLIVKQINKLRNRGERTPTTKPCPKCFSTVNIKATKCAFCTAEI